MGTSLMGGGEVPKQQSQAKVADQTRLALMHMLCASTSAALVEKVEMVCRCCTSKIQQAPTAAKSRTILASILERHAGINVPMLQTHHSHGLLLLQLKCEVFFFRETCRYQRANAPDSPFPWASSSSIEV